MIKLQMQEKKYWVFMPVMMATLLILAVHWKAGIYFETNDDRIINEMLAGTITHIPETHVMVVNYLLSLPISWLYRITPRIPWYGLCLISFQIIAYALIFDGILSACKTRCEFIVGVGVCCGVFLMNFYLIGFIQFTSTAALLAGASYFRFIAKQSQVSLWIFLLAEFLAFLLRGDAMLMIQPFGVAVLVGMAFAEGKLKQKENRVLLGEAFLGLVLVIGLGTVANAVAYSGEEWKEYNRNNQARIQLFDYYGKPAYEEVQDILDKYQVSRTEYEAYCSYIMPDWMMSPECAEELVDYVQDKKKGTVPLAEILSDSWEWVFQTDSLSPSCIVALMWAILVIWILISKCFSLLVPMLGLGAAHTIVWGYIHYKGRILNRVSYGLFACEILMLIVIVEKSYFVGQKAFWKKTLLFGMCGLLIFQCYKVGQRQYRYIQSVNKTQGMFMEGLREIKDYCRSNSDYIYFLDNNSFTHYKGSALEVEIYEAINTVYAGGWNANRPALRAYLREGLESHWDGYMLIVLDDGRSTEEQRDYIAVRYFEEQTGRKAQLEDRLETSQGVNYLIWRL